MGIISLRRLGLVKAQAQVEEEEKEEEAAVRVWSESLRVASGSSRGLHKGSELEGDFVYLKFIVTTGDFSLFFFLSLSFWFTSRVLRHGRHSCASVSQSRYL